MRMKTSALAGTALNWAVAICEGYKPKDFCPHDEHFRDEEDVWFSPSDDWAQGGPIIEREGIELCRLKDGEWRGQLYEEGIDKMHREYGAAPLIAAMRCYVSSKLGEEVEIPEELK